MAVCWKVGRHLSLHKDFDVGLFYCLKVDDVWLIEQKKGGKVRLRSLR